jgi:hypothetical protein
MRIVLAFLLFVHGIAHVPGFIVGWQLGSFPELPFRTTVFGGAVNIGVAGTRVVGAGWLVAAAALIALASFLAAGGTTRPDVTLAVIAFSMVLCAAGWPEARLGLAANGLIIALLIAASRYGALTVDA